MSHPTENPLTELNFPLSPKPDLVFHVWFAQMPTYSLPWPSESWFLVTVASSLLSQTWSVAHAAREARACLLQSRAHRGSTVIFSIYFKVMHRVLLAF